MIISAARFVITTSQRNTIRSSSHFSSYQHFRRWGFRYYCGFSAHKVMPYPSAILLWQQSQEAWPARPGRDQYPLLRYCLDIKREKVKGFSWDGKFQLNLDIQVFRVPLALSTTSLVLSALQGVELVLRLGGAFSLDQALRDRQLTRPGTGA